MTSLALPLSTPSQKTTRLVRQDLPLVKPCWLSQITSLSSMCTASRRICSMIFPGTEGRLTGRYFPGYSFLPFVKMGTMFPPFQSPGTSPDCRDFLNIRKSDLATTSAHSLRTPGCILSGPINVCMFRVLRWSRIWSSLTVGGTFLPQSLPWCPSTQKVWVEKLPVKTVAQCCWVFQPSPHPSLPVW